MRRDRAPLALFGLIAGGLTVHYSNSLVIFASAFLLLLFHKIKKPAVEGQFKTMSMYVFASLFLVNLAEQYLVFSNDSAVRLDDDRSRGGTRDDFNFNLHTVHPDADR
ncbi:hypothetical protein RCO48_09820 [Peribacillus frigoritolerans]|nr:hypothetical protein [Peribacillus frigoritolerans]